MHSLLDAVFEIIPQVHKLIITLASMQQPLAFTMASIVSSFIYHRQATTPYISFGKCKNGRGSPTATHALLQTHLPLISPHRPQDICDLKLPHIRSNSATMGIAGQRRVEDHSI